MEDALIFVFRSLIELYIITFVLRLIMQWIRADTRNPLVQFILRVTNPLVVPLRRYVPTAWGFDTATFVVLFVIQALATTALLNVACTVTPHIGQIISLSLLRLVHLALNVYLFLILAYVILSWIGPGGYNPAVSLLGNIVQPALRPLRRWIPPIAGIDLSPLFALVLIGFVMRLLPSGRAITGLACASFGGGM
ncbi:MAG: YggT family protein [Gammaproteobacteria bacterium]